MKFPDRSGVAFSDEISERGDEERGDELSLIALFTEMWIRRIPTKGARGIHRIIFYGLPDKKQYYLTRKHEEAINPNGSWLR